ncbi:ferredoxin [Rhodococcus opacus]|uniref:Ferredoxin n=1 Tax=Rhodococcus opacus TaxID=37919 RepID=A0A076EXV7_RHOOP|nr:ferredoxin [Rhodococcus opacus]AII10626.1 ferredoxin [Rhodococcus opacus]
MVKLSVDLRRCQGYANCVVASPDVFDLSDEGKVEILQTQIPDDDVPVVEEAVRSCPAAALSMEEAH